ncbi:CHASE domain-containing protein [Propionivibrio sp.]|uniref:CHASE domain-containing protein n=1 Tax=Propionivibrio sp. TaxID=2212460 RepID=UPI003BEF9BC9
MNKQFAPVSTRLPITIFVLGLCLAAITGLWRQNAIDRDAEARFQRNVEHVSANIAQRFLKPVYGLNGLRGMYAARTSVKRAEFRDFVETHNLPMEFPGVRGFGFIEHFMRPDMNAFLAAERADSAPQFAIRQLDEREHEDLYVIKLIEPAVNNAGAEGLDIGSEALRRAAAKQAIDSGETTMTEAITLVQDTRKRPGMLIYQPVYRHEYQPVYRHDTNPATVSERRAALLGLLYAPIVIEELLDGIDDVVQGQINFKLFENGNSLLYDTEHAAPPSASQNALSDHRHVATKPLMLSGRALTLQVASTPGFDAAIDHSSPWVMFAGITFLGALLALLSRQQATGRRRAETRALQMTEELREVSARVTAIVDTMNDGVITIDEQGTVETVNPAVERLWQYAAGELIGQHINMLMPESSRSAHNHHLAHLVASDEMRTAIWMSRAATGLRQDGSLFPLEISVNTIQLGDKRKFVAILHDLTRRNQADDLQLVLTRAIEQSPASILVTDAKSAIQYANPQFEELTGYRLDEIIGKNPMILSSHEKSLEDYQAMWATLLSGQAWQGEFHNRRKDGTLYWERSSISPVRNRNGVLINYVAIKEDITHFKKISSQLILANAELAFQNEENGKRVEALAIANTELAFQIEEKGKRADELAIANEAAQAANIAKSRFLATMSHEIRTPMNGILGMAQMLLMPQITDDERLDYARIVFTSGQTLLNLLNDILDLSKIEAGKYQLESAAFDPCQLVHETRTLFASTSNDKPLSIESGWNGPVGQHYLGDPLRLHQMLSNLVSNAIKFTEQGVIRIEAREIECDQTTAVLEFSVADTGIGIPEDKQALMFLPFSQADSSTTRKYGGSGLGLSIVRHMAQLMDGDVGLDSQAGQGSRFWFRIRAKRVVAGAQGSTSERGNAGIVSPGLAGSELSGRVLVVEDVLANRMVIEAMLTKLGLSVTLAEDGQQGVEAIIGGDTADLILMDVEMPVMDGLAAAAQIRQWEKQSGRARRPIIALTGRAFETDREACLAAGMDDIQHKPVFFKILQALLAKWLPASPRATAEIAVPTVADKPVDVERVVALIEELMPLLKKNRFEAISLFSALEAAVAGTVLAEEFRETGRLLDGLHFGEVLERLRHLTTTPALEIGKEFA